jgi:Prion-inhibition and propagation
MENAGLAIGVPGLLTSCLELTERVEFYKSFEVHSRKLVARFEASKLRLREWASSVGISDDKLPDGNRTRLDHPEVASVVRTILLMKSFRNISEVQARMDVFATSARASKSSFSTLACFTSQ